MNYAESKTYFTLLEEIDDPGSCLIRARLFALRVFCEFLLILPIGLCSKLGRTALRAVGLAVSILCLIGTFGMSSTVRELFMKRVSVFARDLSDWVLLPFALISCFFRLVVAILIHPPLFLRF